MLGDMTLNVESISYVRVVQDRLRLKNVYL